MKYKSKTHSISQPKILKGKFLAEEHRLFLKPSFSKKSNLKFDNRKHLIYITAWGTQYRELSNMLIHSLKTTGEYKDKIYLFTDSLSDLKYLNDTQIKTIIPNIPELNNKSYNTAWLRLDILKYIDTTAFDQIMYLDADILCLKPIEPMFDAFGCLRFVNEGVPARVAPKYNLDHYNKEEYEYYSKMSSINSGQYCVDSKLFIEYMNKWKSLLTKSDQLDQSAFNYMIRKNLIKSKSWHLTFVQFWNENNLKNILIHFPHKDKHTSYVYMTNLYNKLFNK